MLNSIPCRWLPTVSTPANQVAAPSVSTSGAIRFGVSLFRGVRHAQVGILQAFLAKNKEINDLYLATNKLGAMKFVEVLGFEPVDKDQIPMAFLSSELVKHILTVDNSVFLKHAISF